MVSVFDYLDEEYFKLQDFLSVLAESLPYLSISQIKDPDTLIRFLVEQNKAYGRKIVSLFETLDTFYKSGQQQQHDLQGDMMMMMNQPASPDFTSRLYKKISDYEELIKKLTTENEEFASQIKNLSRQIEVIHAKYDANSNLIMANQSLNSHYGSANKGLNQVASAGIGSVSGGGGGGAGGAGGSMSSGGGGGVYLQENMMNPARLNDISFDLESLFLNAEYTKACEVLANIDYKKPGNITNEKYCNWLIMANRIKDFHINEIYNKLQIVISYSNNGGLYTKHEFYNDNEDDNDNDNDDMINQQQDIGASSNLLMGGGASGGLNGANGGIDSERMSPKILGMKDNEDRENEDDGKSKGGKGRGRGGGGGRRRERGRDKEMNNDTIFDRIMNILDEKIPKIIIKKEYECPSYETTPYITKKYHKDLNQPSPSDIVNNYHIQPHFGGNIPNNSNSKSKSTINNVGISNNNNNNDMMHMTANFNTNGMNGSSSSSLNHIVMQRVSMDEGYTVEQYKMKIRYLNNQLINYEKQLEDKSIECEILKDKFENAMLGNTSSSGMLSKTNQLTRGGVNAGDIGGGDSISGGGSVSGIGNASGVCGFGSINDDSRRSRNEKDKENLIKFEDMKRQLEKECYLKRDYEYRYKDILNKYDELNKNNELKDQLLEEMTQEKVDRDKIMEEMKAENQKLKDQLEYIEKLDDIDKLREFLNNKAKGLNEEIGVTNLTNTSADKSHSKVHHTHNNSNPSAITTIEEKKKKYINDIGPDSSRMNTTREREISKAQYVIENNLQNESSSLLGIQHILDHIKSVLLNQFTNLKLSIPDIQIPLGHIPSQVTGTSMMMNMTMNSELNLVESQLANVNNLSPEIKNLLKANLITIKTITSHSEYLKTLINSLITFINDIDPKHLIQAEDNLLNNISMAQQVISQINNIIQPILAQNGSGPSIQLLTLIQNLHNSLSKAIHEFPSIESKFLKRSQGTKDSSNHDKHNNNNNNNNNTNNSPLTKSKGFRDRLLRDFDDITGTLKITFSQLEKQQTNDNFSLLNDEIQKNQDLKNACEGKSLLIHRLNMMFNEGFDRIKVPIESLLNLADSEEAQVLLTFIVNEIANIKSGFNECMVLSREKDHLLGHGLPQIIQKVENEYENQRKIWLRNLEEISKMYEERLNKLIIEIGEERKEHEKMIQSINEVNKKNRIMDDLYNQLNQLTQKLNETEGKLIQKSSDLNEQEIHYGKLERDCMRYIDELNKLKDKIEQKNHEIDELKHIMTKLKDENDGLRQNLNEIVLSKNHYGDTLESKYKNLQNENQQLSEYKAKTELVMKKTSEQIDQIKLGYYSEINALKDENSKLLDSKNKLISELDKKTSDLARLSDMMDELQAFSNKQLETLKAKEEKLTSLTSKLRKAENMIEILEKKLTDLKDKNSKYDESLLQYKTEIKTLKEEFNILISKHSNLEDKLESTTKKNDELIQENDTLYKERSELLENKKALEDKLGKMSDLLQITKTELKNARELIERTAQENANKEWEMKKLKESNEKEREKQIQKEMDTIQLLKKDISIHKSELINLRKEHQRLQDVNERLQNELETLRSSHRMFEQSNKEFERLNTLNKNLSLDLESLRKTTRQKDDQFNVEKEAYIREIQILQKKISDLQGVIDNKEMLLKSLPKSFSGIDSIKSTMSHSSGNSNYMTGLLESKDLEIKRLSQIVKNLTENLKETQESKFALKKQRK